MVRTSPSGEPGNGGRMDDVLSGLPGFCLLVPPEVVKSGRRQWAVPAWVWRCVGALEGWGVSADAQAYFGTRLGLAPCRVHDV
jgi:hypothetical protein